MTSSPSEYFQSWFMFDFKSLAREPFSTPASPIPSSPSPSELSTNAAVLGILSPTPSVGASQGKWMEMREGRYQVVLSQLKAFNFKGNSLENLTQIVKNTHLKNAFQQVLMATESSVTEARQSLYPAFLTELRAAADQIQEDSDEYGLLNAFCFAHFSVDIKETAVGKEFVRTILGDYRPMQVDQLDADQIDLAVHQVTSDKSFQIKCTDLKRRLSANNILGYWDPSYYSVRSKLADIKFKDRDTTFLRMACPVIGHNQSPQIDPLFKGMLRHLKSEGKQYLYINNQSADAQSDGRPIQATLESQRVAALNSLAHDPEFREMFHVISLAHDSEFYKKGSLDLATLKEELLTHITNGAQGFQLPTNLGLDIKDKIQTSINEVADTYFSGQVELSKVERKHFLHIVYAQISRLVIEELKIDVSNITCKDGVDRAAGSAVNLFALSDTEVSFEEIVWTLVFPATLNHGRAPQHHRHSVSIPTLQRIEKAKMPSMDSVASV